MKTITKTNRFTKWVTLGWWTSFALLGAQAILVDLFALSFALFPGPLFFGLFVLLSLLKSYQKDYRFSPYRGFKELLKSR